jgi:hypothetical protein
MPCIIPVKLSPVKDGTDFSDPQRVNRENYIYQMYLSDWKRVIADDSLPVVAIDLPCGEAKTAVVALLGVCHWSHIRSGLERPVSESVPDVNNSRMGSGRPEVSVNCTERVSHLGEKRLVPVNSGTQSDRVLFDFFLDHIGTKCL